MSFELSETAINYAAALAWTAHLDHLKSFFNGIAEDSRLLMEKTCWAEEMSIGARVIRNYALRTLADQCITKESEISPGSSTKLFALLRGLQTQNVWLGSKTLSIEDILERTELPVLEINGLEQDLVIYERLYVTLKSAVRKVFGKSKLADAELSSVLSKLLADYLSSQQSNLTNVNAFEGLASETTAYLKGDSPAPCEWKDVLTTFRSLLEYHVEISSTFSSDVDTTSLRVSKLREIGNNLMTNTCYPQAIQVYTDAIHECDHTTLTHLPQLYTNRAIAYIGLNCFREAVADLEQALGHDQTFVPAWAQMGYCQLYLGSTMLALKCYLASLRSLSGEIYPYKFPANEELRHEYTEAKALTVMPQFVQKLVQSILLAVKRAEQQREPNLKIQEITTKVRAILARLRSHVDSEDLQFLAYTADPEAASLRSSAIRADTVRPSILTPDIAQDIFASGNVEASAVTMNGGPQTRTEFTTPGGPVNSVTQTTTVGGIPIPQPPNIGGIPGNIRGFLNTLGNVVGDAIQVPQPPFPVPQNATPQPPTGERSAETNPGQTHTPTQPPTQGQSPAQAPAQAHAHTQASAPGATGQNNGATNAASAPQQENHISRALSSVRQAISMAQQHAGGQNNGGAPPNSGMMDALRQHQAAVERMLSGGAGVPGHHQARPAGNGNTVHVTRLGPHVSVTHNMVSDAPENQPQNSRGNGRETPSGEDTEMPDAPDLD